MFSEKQEGSAILWEGKTFPKTGPLGSFMLSDCPWHSRRPHPPHPAFPVPLQGEHPASSTHKPQLPRSFQGRPVLPPTPSLPCLAAAEGPVAGACYHCSAAPAGDVHVWAGVISMVFLRATHSLGSPWTDCFLHQAILSSSPTNRRALGWGSAFKEKTAVESSALLQGTAGPKQAGTSDRKTMAATTC